MKKRQTNRPHRAALALLAGALAVFVGLGTFREAGWPRQQLTLTVEAGDPAALQGFTVQGWMSGAAGASGLYGSPRLNFRVEDGVLTSEAVLHYRRESDEMYGSWSEPLTVPAADHDRVDAACERALAFSSAPALRSILTILKNGQDKIPLGRAAETPAPKSSSHHGITRGADAFRKGGANA